MGKIYIGQTDLSLYLETGKDLTGITNVKMIFKSPSGVEKIKDCVVTNVKKGIIKYVVVSAADIDEVGEWTIWAKIVDAQGLVSIGEPSKFDVYTEGM